MLRLRLIVWYSVLVVLTIVAIGLAQNILIRKSLLHALDVSLLDDAKTTLNLISTVPPGTDMRGMIMHGEVHSSNSLRELVDHALSEVPDSLKGTALADRVVSEIIDQILAELAYQDSAGKSADPLDAIVERSVSSRRNNLVQIDLRTDSSGRTEEESFFKTRNLGNEDLRTLVKSKLPTPDTEAALGTFRFHKERIRVVRARNNRFDVYVGYSIADINESLASLTSSFYYLIPLALLVSILGGLWLARKALRPIEQIADTAGEISAKNLSRRIELPGKTDRELVTLTTTLNSMFSRLESSFQQIAQFTSDASHELKTPLAIMKGEIEQAQRHLDNAASLEPSEARGVLESLMEEVERMQRIVEGLLLLSRADDRKLPLEIEQISIYDFLDALCEDGAILAEERELTLRADLDPRAKGRLVRVDTTRLYQVIMNLLDNALKYTPAGGRVSLFLRDGATHVQFGVSDTGIGISAEDLPKIFRRFYRTDEARSGPHNDSERSLGLGLAIVKSIIEALDGTITVQSRLGHGTTFTITLPVVS